ncbi:speckle-type POZ protein-like [Tigriopus californicus]|uniref:speckle-type POZ protein-like n=1 Tax=Tigriopus californicus TaxID=6832 RepID=UPI0027D9D86F|nr:speckle-type POZ protein-like [Tigriopus californicus]
MMWNGGGVFSHSRSSTPKNSRLSHPITLGKHDWTIEDFMTRDEGVGVSLNTKFTVPAHEVKSGALVETIWRIKVYPRGCDADHANYASIFINQVAGPPVWVKYTFCILGPPNNLGPNPGLNDPFRMQAVEHNAHVGSVQFLADRRKSSRGWKKFIGLAMLRAPNNPFLQDHSLVIRCRVELECRDQLHPEASTPDNAGGGSMASPLTTSGPMRWTGGCGGVGREGRTFMDEMKYTDVSLVCEEREFPCHKYMLARKSDVFDAMFSHEFKESLSNRVLITDLSSEAVLEMLRFMYTNRVVHLERINRKLFAAADKYNIGELKDTCEKSLCSNMSIDNVCSLLLFARDRMAEQLKKKAIEFISRNSVDVTNSVGWKDLVHEPALVTEVVQAMGPKYM